MKRIFFFGLFYSSFVMACGPSMQTLTDTETQVSAQAAVNADRSADQLNCLATQIAAMPSPSPSAFPSH